VKIKTGMSIEMMELRAETAVEQGAREQGSEGERERGSEGAREQRERGSEGEREQGSKGAREQRERGSGNSDSGAEMRENKTTMSIGMMGLRPETAVNCTCPAREVRVGFAGLRTSTVMAVFASQTGTPAF
jgi:hypothetical protein